MDNIEEYRYLWEPDKHEHKYVLLYLKGDRLPSFHHPYYHMMAVIDISIDAMKEITVKMLDEGAEVFTNFEDLYAKYPVISNDGRRKRMNENKVE